MLARRYLQSTKNLSAVMTKIREGTAPKKFTITHLKGLGFKSSADRAILGVLKELGFLSDDGTPTQRYHDYRDQSRSKAVMADALREAYEEIFHINERPTEGDRAAIKGKFKSELNVSDSVAKKQAMTFLALLELADLEAEGRLTSEAGGYTSEDEDAGTGAHDEQARNEEQRKGRATGISLGYNVEIHLPATKDIEVYNAIFRSLKEHILDD